jgi:hypothetical protein
LVRDSSWAFPEQASLSLATLQKTFGRLAASKRVLVIDACRNSPDAAKGDAGNRMGDGLCRDIVAAARASARAGMTTALLSSCRSGQRAREWPAKGHGVFTHYLLDGLDGAAWKGEELELEDLAAYAAKEVRRWCASTPGIREPQDPWYEKFGDPEPILLASGVASTATAAVETRVKAAPRRGTAEVIKPPSLHIESVPAGTTVTESQKILRLRLRVLGSVAALVAVVVALPLIVTVLWKGQDLPSALTKRLSGQEKVLPGKEPEATNAPKQIPVGADNVFVVTGDLTELKMLQTLEGKAIHDEALDTIMIPVALERDSAQKYIIALDIKDSRLMSAQSMPRPKVGQRLILKSGAGSHPRFGPALKYRRLYPVSWGCPKPDGTPTIVIDDMDYILLLEPEVK